MLTAAILISAFAFLTNATKLPLGYGVRLNPKEDASPCAVQIEVPVEFAGDLCSIEIWVDGATFDIQTHQLFYRNLVDVADPTRVAFQPTDRVTQTSVNGRYEVSCRAAGTYYIGLTVDSTVNVFGDDVLHAALKSGQNYVIDGQRKYRTGDLLLTEDRWAFFLTNLNAAAIPHWDIDSAIGSSLDNFDYYFGPRSEFDAARYSTTGDSLFVDNPAFTKLSGDTTRDVNAGNQVAGDYVFAVLIKNSIGVGAVTTTNFRVSYELNREPVTQILLPFARVECPQVACDAAENQSCRKCTEGSCHWCPATGKCGNDAGSCQVISDDDQCEDLNARCLSLGSCSTCVGDDRCVWCNRAIGSDICSPGKDDLGAECDANIFQTSIKQLAQCPDFQEQSLTIRKAACDPLLCTACVANPDCLWCDRAIGSSSCKAKESDITGTLDKDVCDVFGVDAGTSVFQDDSQCPDLLESEQEECESPSLDTCFLCSANPKCEWCPRGLFGGGSCNAKSNEECGDDGVTSGDMCPDVLECAHGGNPVSCQRCVSNDLCAMCDGECMAIGQLQTDAGVAPVCTNATVTVITEDNEDVCPPACEEQDECDDCLELGCAYDTTTAPFKCQQKPLNVEDTDLLYLNTDQEAKDICPERKEACEAQLTCGGCLAIREEFGCIWCESLTTGVPSGCQPGAGLLNLFCEEEGVYDKVTECTECEVLAPTCSGSSMTVFAGLLVVVLYNIIF